MTTLPKTWAVLTALVVLTSLASCAKITVIGDSNHPEKMKTVEGNRVSPEKALELAEPYLQMSWEIGCRHHASDHWCKKQATVHIVQKCDHYYIRKTSYPYKSINAYLHHAVKVHVDSGEVTPPSDQ